MGDHAPDTVCFVIDAQNADSHPGAPGRPASGRITAQVIHAAVQGHKDAGGVHHADRPHIAVAHGIPAQSFLIGVGGCLLHRSCHLDVVPVCAVNLQQLHHHPLPRLVDSSGVQHPLVAQLPEGDESLHTEELHKDTPTQDAHHTGLGANSFVQEIVPVPAGTGVIFPAFDGHCLQPAGRR